MEQQAYLLAALRRLYQRLVERRVLSEPLFGQPTLRQRLWRISWQSALILSLPAWALAAWYSYSALVSHYRHVQATKDKVPLSLELFQLHLHDRLARDELRLTMPDPMEHTPLPELGLVLSNDELDTLARMLPPGEGDQYYVNGHVTRGSEIYEVEVRHRGGQHWNWNHPQKSWKVRTRGQVYLDGRNAFNFLNTPQPMPFDEEIVLGIADEQGLLAPDYYPFRLLLNKANMGVYFFEAQPDEGLLRQAGRMPGSIYSGNEAPADPDTGVSLLWKSAEYWTKVAATDPAEFENMEELAALIDVVNSPSPGRFAEFADSHLDVEKFALFDAVDVVFGINQHDFDQNHKLYFDPYKGRFEPIAWNYRDARHEPEFNRTENPLLLRLKQLPGYVSLRNAAVYRLLSGDASIDSFREYVARLLRDLEQDQIRDPHWDAFQLLPDISKYYGEMMRPMSRELQARAAESRLDAQTARQRYLLEVLRARELALALDSEVRGGGTTLDLTVGGEASYRVKGLEVLWADDCAPNGWVLMADSNLSGNLEIGEDRPLAEAQPGQLSVTLELDVESGVELVARSPNKRRGSVRASTTPNVYRLYVVSGCVPARVELSVESLITGEEFTVHTDGGANPAPVADRSFLCQGMGSWPSAGERAPHPWCREQKPPSRTLLGPGIMKITATQVYDESTVVEIAPGTTLEFGEGASMICRGPVFAEGRSDAPIQFQPLGDHWGGIALQGRGTSGSRFRHVELRGGTVPQSGITHFTGMFNIHDTSDIQLSNVKLSRNLLSDDALHVAYVRGLSIAESTISHAAADGIDLEFSQAELRRVIITSPGDDAVDMMESEVDIADSVLLRCKGNAVSAGERSNVSLTDVLAADGTRGVLVKNSSTVSLSNTLLYRNEVGVRVEAVSDWYPGRSRVLGETLHAVECARQVESVGRDLKRVGRITDRIGPGELEQLRAGGLGIAAWNELDSWLAARNGDARP